MKVRTTYKIELNNQEIELLDDSIKLLNNLNHEIKIHDSTNNTLEIALPLLKAIRNGENLK